MTVGALGSMEVWTAFGLTAFAGLATGIGSVAALFARRTNTAFLATSLGFSAGVMIYISFVELLRSAEELLIQARGEDDGQWIALLSFFGGVALIAIIDFVVPTEENPHDASLIEDLRSQRAAPLKRAGVLTALAIGLHNFPEGLATFVAALDDPTVGTAIAIAIALHNIPEGISVAIPIYFATGSRKKAFWYSFCSGLSEPLGAALGYLAIGPYLTDAVLGVVEAMVAGVMVFISLDQLIPNAKRYEQGHQSVYGLIGGMVVISITLLLL